MGGSPLSRLPLWEEDHLPIPADGVFTSFGAGSLSYTAGLMFRTCDPLRELDACVLKYPTPTCYQKMIELGVIV